jgi:hypothetical protein
LRKGGGGLGCRVVKRVRLALLVVAPVRKPFDLNDDVVDVATNVPADVVPAILFVAEIDRASAREHRLMFVGEPVERPSRGRILRVQRAGA